MMSTSLRRLLQHRLALPVALASSACLFAGAAWQFIRTDDALAQARQALVEVQVRQQALPASQKPAPKQDFTQSLPLEPQVHAVLQELQRSTQARGVVLTSVSTAMVEATPQRLGRVSFAVILQGSYAPLKGVLADLLDRYANLAVQGLTLQRRGTPLDVEARLELLLLSRPLAVAPATASAAPP